MHSLDIRLKTGPLADQRISDCYSSVMHRSPKMVFAIGIIVVIPADMRCLFARKHKVHTGFLCFDDTTVGIIACNFFEYFVSSMMD